MHFYSHAGYRRHDDSMSLHGLSRWCYQNRVGEEDILDQCLALMNRVCSETMGKNMLKSRDWKAIDRFTERNGAKQILACRDPIKRIELVSNLIRLLRLIAGYNIMGQYAQQLGRTYSQAAHYLADWLSLWYGLRA